MSKPIFTFKDVIAQNRPPDSRDLGYFLGVGDLPNLRRALRQFFLERGGLPPIAVWAMRYRLMGQVREAGGTDWAFARWFLLRGAASKAQIPCYACNGTGKSPIGLHRPCYYCSGKPVYNVQYTGPVVHDNPNAMKGLVPGE